ncbi:hypothetical protein BH24ACT26_BH24ACT26_06860 [soil metagenome]
MLPPTTMGMTARDEAILRLYEQGHSPREIGQKVGLVAGRVVFTLRRHGATLRAEDREQWDRFLTREERRRA